MHPVLPAPGHLGGLHLICFSVSVTFFMYLFGSPKPDTVLQMGSHQGGAVFVRLHVNLFVAQLCLHSAGFLDDKMQIVTPEA